MSRTFPLLLTSFSLMALATIGCQAPEPSSKRRLILGSGGGDGGNIGVEPGTGGESQRPSLEPVQDGSYDPLAEIRWTEVQDYGNVTRAKNSPHFRDVVGHTNPNDPSVKREQGLNYALDSTAIHETGHVLHHQLRRIASQVDGEVEAVYYEDGKGIAFKRPNVTITEYAGTLPAILRPAASYDLYLVEQPANDPSYNNVGYLFNEWMAYNMNIRMLLELEEAGTPEPGPAHASNSAPYFFGYVAYGIHALQQKDPAAFDDAQFKAAFAICAQYTWKLMRRTLKSPVFGTVDPRFGASVPKLMDFYRNSPEFAAVRQSLAAIYGQDWVERTIMAD